MSEKYGLLAILLGAALVLIGWLWLILRAYRVRRAWGIGCFIFPPAAIFFSTKHFAQAKAPLLLLGLGLLTMGGTYGMNYYVTHHLSLGSREKIVAGEKHITLTGWDSSDYSVLRQHSDVVVLQMANANVTDQTLINLEGLTQLQELDLNDTQVTDLGLATLVKLPKLKILRLRKTAITDAGFLTNLLPLSNLQELDLRETAVASKSLRDWKKQQPDSRKFLK